MSAPTKDEILKLVAEYINEKHKAKKWEAGKDWVQYAGPVFNSDEFVAATNALLNEWLVLGTDAIQFEREFPKHLGKSYGIVTNSGSSANLLMLLTAKKYFNLKDGDKVIVPVAGFPTTVNPILQVGLVPVFVDIELETLNLNINQVEEAARNGAKVLMFAHVLGNPPNLGYLTALRDKYNLIILEDCCDALGTTYKGYTVGTFADMATCSFYPAHHMTMGEGGFVACSNERQETIARSFREWGRGCYCVGKKANLSMQGSCGCRFSNWLPAFPKVTFDHKYVYENIGYNLKPIELQCSIGLAQMKKLPYIHEKRKQNHARLTQIFRPYEEYFHIHAATDESDPSWFAFPITLKDGLLFDRFKFTSFLESKKIQTRTYFGGNLLLQPAYEGIEWYDWEDTHFEDGCDHSDKLDLEIIRDTFPVATKVTTDTFFLGTSPVITSEQLDYIQHSVAEFFI